MAAAEWYYVQNGESVGPVTVEELLERLPQVGGERAMVFGPGLANWTEARHVSALRPSSVGAGVAPPPQWSGRKADEIDYQVFGDDMQYVEVGLDPGEMVVAEAGAMMYMGSGVEMNTSFGDPSADQGFFGKVLNAGKRLLTGESLFLTTFTGRGPGRQTIAFAAPYPGKIIPIDLTQQGGEVLCQKESFLCCARGVQVGIAFTKRIGAGLFGGEGFILQRLKGDGIAFVHAGGTICNKRLAPGEMLKVDTGCLVAFQPSVSYDIRFVGGIRNTLFGGEGLFFAELTGPGDVWLQSLPFVRLADRIHVTGKFGKQTDS